MQRTLLRCFQPVVHRAGLMRSVDMDFRRRSNGFLTFLEHWWFLPIAILALVGSQVVSFFTRLTGVPWIYCYALGVGISIVGVALIVYAKLPLYRRLRFFTFGSAALPPARRPLYRWGYRCVLFAAALLLCLFLSKP